MALDRCITIVTPLKAGKIRVSCTEILSDAHLINFSSQVFYLCGSAWFLAALLSTPNIFIFHLRTDHSGRYCTAVFNQQSTRTGRRIYLTFISLVVYFIPFLVLVLCYTLIFIKLLRREQDQDNDRIKQSSISTSSPSSSPSCCSWLFDSEMIHVPKFMFEQTNFRSSSNRSSFTEFDARRKRTNAYVKARTKTFRMVKNVSKTRSHKSVHCLLDEFVSQCICNYLEIPSHYSQ